MINYEQLLPNRSALPKEEITSKSVKLKAVIKNNYPQVESQDEIGYTLVSRDEQGNEIKRQYHKWRNRGKNMSINYSDFEKGIAEKKALSKFLTIDIGDSATYELVDIKQATQISSFSGEQEGVWLVSLQGIDPDFPQEKKNWSVTSLSVISQFKEQDIQNGDRILIERIAKGEKKSTYKIKKLAK